MALTQQEKERYLAELRAHHFSLQVIRHGMVIFTSNRTMLKPVLECFSLHGSELPDAVVIDRVVGRAAALLFARARVTQVITLLASQAAQSVCNEYKIDFHAERVVANIMNRDQSELCPMEQLALGCKTPEEFYQIMKDSPAGKLV